MITIQHVAKEDKKINFVFFWKLGTILFKIVKNVMYQVLISPLRNNLFLCKTWCLFIEYMQKKPDKFGIKFALLVDVCSKYLCNGKPYLGKDPTRDREKDLPTDFCLCLMQLKKGYNVTMNNYFTSINLANKLKVEKTTLFGTVRKKKQVPKVEEMMKKFLYNEFILKKILYTYQKYTNLLLMPL